MASLHKVRLQSNIIYRRKKIAASAGNRTRIDCLEGNHADLYTTDACDKCCYIITTDKIIKAVVKTNGVVNHIKGNNNEPFGGVIIL